MTAILIRQSIIPRKKPCVFDLILLTLLSLFSLSFSLSLSLVDFDRFQPDIQGSICSNSTSSVFLSQLCECLFMCGLILLLLGKWRRIPSLDTSPLHGRACWPSASTLVCLLLFFVLSCLISSTSLPLIACVSALSEEGVSSHHWSTCATPSCPSPCAYRTP